MKAPSLMKWLYPPLLALGLLLSIPSVAAVNYFQLTQKELVKLAEEGDIQAIWYLQEPAYFDKKKKQSVFRPLEERLVWMRKGAELGDYRMQMGMALRLLPPPVGTSTTPDLAGAEAWLVQTLTRPRRAGASPDAFHHQHVERLLEWVRLLQRQPAAEAGDAEAMFGMAQAYAPNKVFNMELGNPVERQRWLALAVGKGHPGAALSMAKDSPTLDEKLKWYRLAADGGNAEAMAVLGH